MSNEDGWSSLDEGRLGQGQSESDSDSSSSQSSLSDSLSESTFKSSSSESVVVRRKKKRTRPLPATTSKISTRANSPKSARKSILDSLAKKRRMTMSNRKVQSWDSESSERDFVVSDNHESSDYTGDYSSESSSGSSRSSAEDFGFYARVSSMMDKRDRKSVHASETLSPRMAFFEMLKYYGLCFMNPKAQFPSHIKTFKRQLPVLEAAIKKIESSLVSRKQITTPSYWKPDSDLVQALNKYPIYNRSRFRHMKELCDGCNKQAQLSATITLKGNVYDSDALWKGDVRSWLKSMRLPLLTGKQEESSDSEDGSSSSESGSDHPELPEEMSMTFGDKCLSNVQIYHTLQHAKHRILMDLYRWMVAHRLASDSGEKFLKTLQDNREGIVEQWYEKYKEDTELSEKNCARFTDPLGSYSPPPMKDAKKRRHTTGGW